MYFGCAMSNVRSYYGFSMNVTLLIHENVWKLETSFILFNFSGVYLILWEHAELGAEECVLGAEALDRSGMCC